MSTSKRTQSIGTAGQGALEIRSRTADSSAAGAVGRKPVILWCSVAGLTLLSALLTLVDLGRNPLWHDEGFTGFVATRSTSGMLAIIAKREGNMPLYYLMEHVWSSAGTSPLWLRLPSALAGIATIPVTGLVGRRIFGDRVGLMAALLLTVNGFLLHYAREARTYSLVTLLAAVATVLLLEAVDRRSNRLWFAYGITAVLMIGAQPLSALMVLIVHGASLAMAPPRRSERRLYLSVVGVLLSLNGLVMLYIVLFQRASTDFIQATTLTQLEVFIYDLAGGGAFTSLTLVGAMLGACFIALGILGVLTLGRATRQMRGVGRWQHVLVLNWLLLPSLLLVLVSLVRPSWRERYLTVVTPAAFLIVALAIAQIRARALRTSVLAVVLALAGVSAVHTLRQKAIEDIPAGAAMLLSRSQPGDAIVYSGAPTRTPFLWVEQQLKADRPLPSDIALAPGGEADKVHDLFAKEVDARILTSRLARRKRVWVVSLPTATWHPTPEPMQTVQRGLFWRHTFRRVSQQDFGNLRVELYQRIAPA